jgi:hypothetical protein
MLDFTEFGFDQFLAPDLPAGTFGLQLKILIARFEVPANSFLAFVD